MKAATRQLSFEDYCCVVAKMLADKVKIANERANNPLFSLKMSLFQRISDKNSDAGQFKKNVMIE